MSLFGGLDLCLFPAGNPPDGVQSNFEDPPTYAPTVVAVTVVVLFFATLFTGCRLMANWKNLTWGDYLNALALVFSVGQSGIMLAQLKFVRHQWDIPACWLFGNYAKLIFAQQMMLTPGLILSKVAIFLLFLQIFEVDSRMRLAIRIGIVLTGINYLPNIPIEAYFQAPGVGESWEGVMASGKPIKASYWGLVQSSLGIILDVYMFILPLPTVSRLQISRTKRIQLLLVFSTAFMGVVANIVSLVYRVAQFRNMQDATWNLYALLLCTVVELNIAIIVCSVPGLARFCKVYAATWTPIQSLRSKLSRLGGSTAGGSNSPKRHGWPAPQLHTPKSLTDEEAGMTLSTSVSSYYNTVDRTHDRFEMRERWDGAPDMPMRNSSMSLADSEMSGADPDLVDPYLDIAGPDYSWLHTSSHNNAASGGVSQDHTGINGFRSVRGP
ncbi:hypothetical protein DHEL01_v206733 [Diaporthe helianthi]|uniref:Rhodopsin domain-containing protein n=1 Tax=Diaporthe helianthi TaxID=158607 RepID=A0A2P5HX87_DIAHE|nr:hypothetical protein DHEL01_v206733 [Diaporthe helianthi]